MTDDGVLMALLDKRALHFNFDMNGESTRFVFYNLNNVARVHANKDDFINIQMSRSYGGTCVLGPTISSKSFALNMFENYRKHTAEDGHVHFKYHNHDICFGPDDMMYIDDEIAYLHDLMILCLFNYVETTAEDMKLYCI